VLIKFSNVVFSVNVMVYENNSFFDKLLGVHRSKFCEKRCREIGVHTIETKSFETIHLRPLHLRPSSFETTSFETCSFDTCSFDTTFI